MYGRLTATIDRGCYVWERLVTATVPGTLPLPLEELNGPLVLFGAGARSKGSEISAPARLWIDLPRIQAIVSGFEFTNHRLTSAPEGQRQPLLQLKPECNVHAREGHESGFLVT